ncbi:hypothetical protein I3760_12G105900 [Carya illinoinensis]|nr:hypothetical protein I3760_12G105900 [Carya illinoinensis]
MRTSGNLPPSIGLKDGGCPYGTVPIMRIDEDGLARAKMNTKIMYLSNINEEPGYHYAILQTKPALTRKIEGIQASFSAYNTKGVDGLQHSSFRMMLSNGLDSIKTGFTMDGRTQCFNNLCPGYIHLDPQIPLGWPVDTISIVDGEQYSIKLQVLKEYIGRGPNTTEFVWTLRFELENTILGFWPTSIFSKLSEFGDYADWGGEVYSPLDQPSPIMGTGIRPLRYQWSTARSAHSHFVAIAYEDSQSEFENPNDTEVYESDPETYSILDIGVRKDKGSDYLIVYDGPGGIKSN